MPEVARKNLQEEALASVRRPARNEHPDYLTEFSAAICVGGTSAGRGIIRKIGMLGIGIETEERVPSRCRIEMELPFERPFQEKWTFRVEGEIGAGEEVTPPFRYRVLFPELDEETKNCLIELIAQLLMSGKARSSSREDS